MFGERRRGWHAWLWWFVTALLCAAVRRYSHVDYGAFWKAHWWQAAHLGGEPVALLRGVPDDVRRMGITAHPAGISIAL